MANYECPCPVTMGTSSPQIHEPFCHECEACGERYCTGIRHLAACGLACAYGALYIEDNVVHDIECSRCASEDSQERPSPARSR